SIVTRVNTVTGRAYADDPTILSYELMNEIRPVTGQERTQYDWVNEMSRYIKTLDPWHMVSSGFDDPHDGWEEWALAGKIANVDYLDVHLYPGGAPSAHNPAHDWPTLWAYL